MQSTLAISDAEFSDIGDYSCAIGDTATADNTIFTVTSTEANLQVNGLYFFLVFLVRKRNVDPLLDYFSDNYV